ncbi:MAG: aminodeoxychorismate synthase component I [Flavobacteriales bacterium]|nr:aminodeoxychorismate synthase component I [Flavobacteriales bacterium]
MNVLGQNKTPFFFMIDYELQKPKIFQLDKLPENLFFKTHLFSKNLPFAKQSKSVDFNVFPIDFDTYSQAFKVVKLALNRGNSYLTNLTFQTPIKTNLSLTEIYNRSNSSYKLLYNNQFVCFSPESFVKINGGKIFSFPMKGTIDASIPNAKEIILNDKKETAEHHTIVDLIRNDLSMVAKQVTVEKLRYVEKIETNNKSLLQVSSKISGVLPDNYVENIGDIIAKLLPAGSICGAPKRETLNIIRQAENYKRGYYTGIMGVFDRENLDSAVLIRYIENENGQLIYKSGGGITHLSDAQSEYQELIQKVYVPFN